MENPMIFDCTPGQSLAQLLAEASARTGLTLAEVEDLIDCDLETDHLLNYIHAMTHQRMN
jgi:hypothetical protein